MPIQTISKKKHFPQFTSAGKKVFIIIFILILSIITFIEYLYIHEYAHPDYNSITTERDELKKTLEKQNDYNSLQSKLSDINKELDQLKNKSSQLSPFDSNFEAKNISVTSEILTGGLQTKFEPPYVSGGYDGDITTVEDGKTEINYTSACLVSDKDSGEGTQIELEFSDNGDFKLIKYTKENSYDLGNVQVKRKDRALSKTIISKEYNLDCLDGSKMSMRKIYNGKIYLGYFIYSGKDTDEYILSNNGLFLFGRGAPLNAYRAEWSILNLKTAKFGQLTIKEDKNKCLDTKEPEYNRIKDQITFNTYEYITTYQKSITVNNCVFKMDGSFVAGYNTIIFNKENSK